MSRPAVVQIQDLRSYRKRFVTAAELAAFLCVPRSTVYYHIKKGALKARRIGTVIRIPKDEAIRYSETPA